MRSVLRNTLLASTALLAGVFAGSFSDVARRKGFTESMIRDRLNARDMLEERAVNTSEYRFLNKKTEKYFVKSLPEVPQSYMTEMYAGLVPIDMKNTSRALYFVYTPTVGKPVETITIWLNGGPGCSSLEGFFQENGRIIWSWGMYAPEINPYAWSNLTNVLWVEQPVGTGFSIGEPTATSEEDIAADFVAFFANFQEIFGIKNFEIYVTGESCKQKPQFAMNRHTLTLLNRRGPICTLHCQCHAR
jgi:carboxypeptidase D